ncbi:MAG: N-6 DNA methylase [Armatimonadota bacterium]
MNNSGAWLFDFGSGGGTATEGLVAVAGYDRKGLLPEQVAIMEKAAFYKAQAVFFEAPHDGKPPLAQAFIYRSDGPAQDPDFAHLHQRLWSWGGVPLVYRVTAGLVQLFRCAHRPDFEENGQIVCRPFKKLELASKVANDPWWDADRLRNGTLWDDPQVCKKLLSSNLAAQRTLITAVKKLHDELNQKEILPKVLRRKLLILSVLIAYLEERDVFEAGYFDRFKKGANKFFQILADGPALVGLLEHLEDRFNGHVFILSDEERETLSSSKQLPRFARLIEARQESNGQLSLWKRYSFADLPVELISHIYQLFVHDSTVAVYTPQFLVRLMLGEVLSWERLDRLEQNDEVILDGACGSGIFLVEAYKRLVLHWRYRNDWKHPNQTVLKKLLTSRIRGVDLEPGAVELASFSLCLAVCDALEPMEIRASVKLFPLLKERFIHTGCFFEAREKGIVKDKVGVIVGNPPFASKLTTEGAQRAYDHYQEKHGDLPDKQVAYLFLHESMEMLAPGGVLSMLQQYNFLYNQQSLGFRRKFIERWDVREILDFISVRGLFQKGSADTKVIAVVAEAQPAPPNRQILHATFRRSGRADAEQGFDIDYYDMHWLPRELAISSDGVWRSDLFGGGRLLAFAGRVKRLRTLRQLGDEFKWEIGEGWILGNAKDGRPAKHVVLKKLVQTAALSDCDLDSSKFDLVPNEPIQWPRRPQIYTPPLLLIHKHEDLSFGTWNDSYLTYQHTIVGVSAATGNRDKLNEASCWLTSHKKELQALLALGGTSAFASKATAVLSDDILQLPFPDDWSLNLSAHEKILVADIVDYYRDLIRLGEDSAAMKKSGAPGLLAFNEVFTARINGIYKKNKLRPLPPQVWPGVICQPYVFGKGVVDWSGADELKGKVDALLREKRGGGLNITRIARLYDGACIYLVKPDRLRYWLRSVALRDADETLADLAEQGF